MQENIAGPIQRVQHPGPVSKDPGEEEVHFLPNYPHGQSKQTLETQRLTMVEQFKRTSMERDMIFIHQHMQHTFVLRREEIVNLAPPVTELMDRWPALFCEAQVSIKLKIMLKNMLKSSKSSLVLSGLIWYVCLKSPVLQYHVAFVFVLFFMQHYSEFHRIINQNLPSAYFAALNKYTPQLLNLYKKRRTGRFGQKMEAIMMASEEQVSCFFLFFLNNFTNYTDVECEA